MKKTYQITYTKYEIIEIDDKEMIENGYEAPITDSMREEYLENLLDENHFPYDDIEIEEIDLNE